MDLRHLRCVVVAARNTNFNAAGHELNVRQPIISKRIRELEDELGVFLFDRAISGARLTPKRNGCRRAHQFSLFSRTPTPLARCAPQTDTSNYPMQ